MRMTIPYLKKILISARPNTWLRVWGEMIVAAALARTPIFHWWPFLFTFIATSPLLWTAGYMLNDHTDRKLDAQHPYRKNRPIAKGDIVPTHTGIIITILILCAFLVARLVNMRIVFLLVMLMISQGGYTLHPFRLKERPVFDIGVNAINSIVRFLLGWFSQSPTIQIPYLMMGFFMCVKIIFFMGHRMQNVLLERNNHIQSTVTNSSPLVLQNVFALIALIGAACFSLSLLWHIIPPTALLSLLGALPLAYYILSRRGVHYMDQEKNATFRTTLYFSYFLWANILAIVIVRS